MKLLGKRKSVLSSPPKRIETLVRKIESYQLEIEEHRQKLEKMRDALRDSSSRYVELYELAPVGFLTLDRKAAPASSATILATPTTR